MIQGELFPLIRFRPAPGKAGFPYRVQTGLEFWHFATMSTARSFAASPYALCRRFVL